MLSVIESEMLSNLVTLLVQGDADDVAWQARKLQQLGLLRGQNFKTIQTSRVKLLAAVRKEIEREAMKRAGMVDDATAGAGKSLASVLPANADPAIVAVIDTWEKAAAKKFDQAFAPMLSKADQIYTDTIYKAVAKQQLGISGRQAIAEACSEWSQQGLQALTDSAGRQWTTEAYAQTVIRSNMTQAATETQFTRMEELGEDLVEISSHLGARPKCEPYQGKIFSISGTSKNYPWLHDPANTPWGDTIGRPDGLFGINCVLEGTFIDGPSENAVYRRKYTGELFTIRTAAGNELSVTPNHPILTDKGWVKAQFLAVGDNVISRTRLNREGLISPYPNHGITTVEQKFDALLNSGDVYGLPSSSCNLHGDIPDHDVDVIFRKGFLSDRINTARNEHIEQNLFCDTTKTPYCLKCICSLNKAFIRSLHSFHGFMCLIRNRLAPLFPTSFMNTLHNLRLVICKWNAKKGEVPSNGSFANTNFVSDFILPQTGVIQGEKIAWSETCLSEKIVLPILTANIDTFTIKTINDCLNGTVILPANGTTGNTGMIQTDCIIDIKRETAQSSFVHVYNLETELGWYYSNNIISHNCRHVMYPYFPGTEKTFAPQNEERNATAYANSQKQRALERSIREGKRNLDLMSKTKDEKQIDRAKELLRNRERNMREFIDSTGRKRRTDREEIYL